MYLLIIILRINWHQILSSKNALFVLKKLFHFIEKYYKIKIRILNILKSLQTWKNPLNNHKVLYCLNRSNVAETNTTNEIALDYPPCYEWKPFACVISGKYIFEGPNKQIKYIWKGNQSLYQSMDCNPDCW